jgi:hypothetical protein
MEGRRDADSRVDSDSVRDSDRVQKLNGEAPEIEAPGVTPPFPFFGSRAREGAIRRQVISLADAN